MSQSLFRGVVGLAMLLSLGCSAMQQAILRDTTGFKVLDKGRWNQVKSYDVDPTLRKMNVEQLRKFLAAGCKIRASKCTNGDYVLRSFVPGKGGGPIWGCITAVVGTVATGVTATAVFIVTLPAGPVVAGGTAVATAQAGMAATVYATAVTTAAPTP